MPITTLAQLMVEKARKKSKRMEKIKKKEKKERWKETDKRSMEKVKCVAKLSPNQKLTKKTVAVFFPCRLFITFNRTKKVRLLNIRDFFPTNSHHYSVKKVFSQSKNERKVEYCKEFFKREKWFPGLKLTELLLLLSLITSSADNK